MAVLPRLDQHLTPKRSEKMSTEPKPGDNSTRAKIGELATRRIP